MKQSSDFMEAMADFDLFPNAVIWRAGSPQKITKQNDNIEILLPMYPFRLSSGLLPAEDLQPETLSLFVEHYSGGIIRLTTEPGLPESPMLEPGADLEQTGLFCIEDPGEWKIVDSDSRVLAIFNKKRPCPDGWSSMIRPSFDTLEGIFFPEKESVELGAYDQFFPEKIESLPLAYVEYQQNGITKRSTLFSFKASYNEHFAGTGERFAEINLAGKTLILENTDALGTNSRRAYKNVPFFLSSRGYGLFVHSSSHMRFSLSDISTRAAQGRIEDGKIDLFIISGKTPERVLYNYRRLTGFPPQLPLWSYGTWMSRMTYFSADEIDEIADRLRKEEFPCDIIHIDTGWFEKDWVCEWRFSKERFPEPDNFIKRLRNKGYRVSLWQTPNIGEGNCLLEEAKTKRYLAPQKQEKIAAGSDFSGQNFGGQIDFTNSEAIDWYQNKIRYLLETGASVIKTDFGEKIQFDADYLNMPADKLHNIYGLLYQKAAYEETVRTTGEGIIWGRAGWAGAQRYPLHWGGDTASNWDGMAATLRGGLHLGLSGFGFWSHDVPGFHGLPEFMNTPPSNNLYIRWTQFGVFTSHLRYHGTSPREPWFFPEIAPLIRKWLNLRYSLIPYLMQQAEKTNISGFPILRAMLLHFPEDPVCWNIDDQFFCGDNFLICPVMNDNGVRNVYLPEGRWTDFWTGRKFEGGKWLMDIESSIDTLPVFCPEGAEIPVYPEIIQCTDQMDFSKIVKLRINNNFTGYTL